MQISHLISESCVVPNLVGENKKEVLLSLSAVFLNVMPNADVQHILELFLEREKLGTTGIGNGIAIPHGRIKGLKNPIAVFGRSVAGVPFEANDGKPVHIVVALLSPASSGRPHLQALSAISQTLNNSFLREKILQAKDKKTLYNAVIKGEK
ncbi:MAG: PTS sugar transporter subunit IIA [Magnetococcales bacterium]|nr:PTS sugar transporter subunit IIA [Magnetococcales bacterium]